MKITQLRTNHLEAPLGYRMDTVVFTWTTGETDAKKRVSSRVLVAADERMQQVLYDSGERSDIDPRGFVAPLSLTPCTRYYWRVCERADNGDAAESDVAWFETAKMEKPFCGRWITAPFGKERHVLLRKPFTLSKKVKRARVYACGLGVYELYINGHKAGDEVLAPFHNDYELWLQYQTYDVTNLLSPGDNAVGVSLGNGWYKGRFGFIDKLDKLYGDTLMAIADIVIEYEDGTQETLATDESWLAAPSPVLESSIYDGETFDANLAIDDFSSPVCAAAAFVPVIFAKAPAAKLTARLSPPVRIIEEWPKKAYIDTPKRETVVDFGQVMTGWVEFDLALPKGTELTCSLGELLQEGNFYNENLRTAKQKYRYISDGAQRRVRPHFTFYGFRYMKLECAEEIPLSAIHPVIIHSALAEIGHIATSNEKVDRLVENARWSQKGNFLDVPTDCPQRDERMGWTGDAQVFAPTASYTMYTPAFYKKYLYDMYLEQKQFDGSVPHVVPDILGLLQVKFQKQHIPDAHGSCAWGDAATVIPWTVYLFFGDKALLQAEYENMTMWVDYIRRVDETKCGGKRLWTSGFHFADWLALDNPEQGSSFGGTDPYYVASAYYYFSTVLASKAAKALGKAADHEKYSTLAAEIREAIRHEYFTDTGRLAVPTQTALAMALYMEFVPDEYRARTVQDLKARLDARKVHLDTGFVGTYELPTALTKNGLADYAYTLLLNEDFPSWLYEVNMGATTIWERWNSVLPNGLVSDTGMNSMNHYAYGSIVEWMYRCMAGLNPVEDAPGFKRARIKPYVDARFTHVEAQYDSASGRYESGWTKEAGGYRFLITVPFDAEADFELTFPATQARVDGAPCPALIADGKRTLPAGRHELFVAVD